MKKLPTLGCINAAPLARIQIMDLPAMKWKTLAECADTPNTVKKLKEELLKEGHKNLWLANSLGERRPLF